MHRDLEGWLNEVWRDREAIFKNLQHTGRAISAVDISDHPGINRIYKKYKTGSSGASGMARKDTSRLPTFLRRLADYVDRRSAKCDVQYGGRFYAVEPHQLRELAGDQELCLILYQDHKPDEAPAYIAWGDIERVFMHVSNPDNHGQGAVDQRIYLNLQSTERARHFLNIVEGIYRHPGFHSAKVVSLGASPRNDTALLYLRGDEPVAVALAHITRYQKDNEAAFCHGLPRLTKPVGDLIGVGRGMEPPQCLIIRQGDEYYAQASSVSFGQYRSALIFMALDRTHWIFAGYSDDDLRTDFKRRVAKYFRVAGIDPENPSRQAIPDYLEPYWR